MQVRDDIRQADPVVARAFIQLFVQTNCSLQMGRDSGKSDEPGTLTSYLTPSTSSLPENSSTITVTVEGDISRFESVEKTLFELGGNEHRSARNTLGESNTAHLTVTIESAHPPLDSPHCLVYGWLHPDIREAVNRCDVFSDCELEQLETHYTIYGESVSAESLDQLNRVLTESSDLLQSSQTEFTQNLDDAIIL